MAVRNVTFTQGEPGFVKAVWEGLLNTDSGAPVKLGVYGDASVQAFGTFGAGGTVILEGSNDGGVTYFPLTDPGGGAISFTTAGGEAVLQYCEMVRPRVTAGDGTTDLDVYLVARKPI